MSEIILMLGAVVLGCILLYAGGELGVRGADSIAKRFSLSHGLVGAVLLGFGTSLPELFTTIQAASKGHFDIVYGNIIGSNIANLMLILPLAFLWRPPTYVSITNTKQALLVCICSLIYTGVIYDQGVSLLESLFLLLLFMLSIYTFHYLSKAVSPQTADTASAADTPGSSFPQTRQLSPTKSLLLLSGVVLGLVLMPLGAYFLLLGSSELARYIGISEAVIGLSLVAVGTSLPELFSTIAACRKSLHELALSNLLGSNIFNLLLIGGVVEAFFTFQINYKLARVDILFMLGISILTTVLMWRNLYKLRFSSLLIFLFFVIYIITISQRNFL